MFSLDPISLLLSQNSDNNNNLSYFERGPKYSEYAKLRESKLRLKHDFEKILKEEEERFFGAKPVTKPKKRFSLTGQEQINKPSTLAQSVPDFSSMIRKENRCPVNTNLPSRRVDVTPPPKKSRNYSTRGSISANAGEKKSRVIMARKSYANVEELKKIFVAAASEINNGGRGGGRKSIGGGSRSVLGYRQIY